MNRETLDRLLVDRALGALDADSCELLAAYLVHDGDAAKRAEEFALAAELARGALGAACDSPLPDGEPHLPPFPAARLARVERSRRRLLIITRAASLAACLLLGIAVGAWAVRPGASGPSPLIRARSASEGQSLAPRPPGTAVTPSTRGTADARGSQDDAAALGGRFAARPAPFVQTSPMTEQGFWSVRRYYEQARKAGPAHPPQVEWFSPVREPRIGGAS
jgi:hypothetical protein